MVWSIGTVKMTMKALNRLLDAGSISRTLSADGVEHQKFASQHLTREFQEADEVNLLDEEDMHIFGLRPMTDPLELVCCNACRKPIKASQYAAHSELCKSFSSGLEVNLEHRSPAVDKKPPRKERKKLLNPQRKKVSSFGELKKVQSLNSGGVTSTILNKCLNSAEKVNGLRGGILCDTKTIEFATENLSKHVKRTTPVDPPNPCAMSPCKKTELVSYLPAPLATKIYYSQRTHRLRTALHHMFFETSNAQVDGISPNAASLGSINQEQVFDPEDKL